MVKGKDYQSATQHLKRRDRVLRRIIDEVGPCTLGPSTNYFLTLVEAIVWQQLSWKAACAIFDRVLAALGTSTPRPDDFLGVSPASLLEAGLSRQKLRYLRELSSFFVESPFDRKAVAAMSDAEVIETLTAIKGIGVWTAEMFLIFGLNRPDVFPSGDLGLQKAIGRYYRREKSGLPSSDEIERITERWRPYRTIGAWYLWETADGTPLA